MTIMRSEGFYSPGLYNFDWRQHFTLKDLRKKYEGWEFKEFSFGYRFVDPERSVVKYYRNDGNVLELPCRALSFE